MIKPLLHFLFSLFCVTAMGQNFVDVSGDQIVDENSDPLIIRSVGLNGWMLQEGSILGTEEFAPGQHQLRELIEELVGPTDTQAFYDAWLTNYVQKGEIDLLKSWGFNTVTIPLHYNLFTLPVEDEPVPGENTWLETGFTLTDNIIAWAKANQMYVILELKAAPGGQSTDPERSDYDDEKPSLWEDQANRDKTVALWQRIAETYADEASIAGYGLLNEPDVASGADLKAVYEQITTAIRSVDANHVLYIHGNNYGMDFTDLTPAWDNKIVYTSNKLATFNDQGSIQDLISLRDATGAPVLIARISDNSNGWFRDAVRLLENNAVGWNLTPLKRVQSVNAPFVWTQTELYNRLLAYWKGTAPEPSAITTNEALADLLDGIKLENIDEKVDVVDAVTRQRSSNAAKPFSANIVPGVIYATEFDLGGPDVSYVDDSVANFQNSTGNFTRWNNGLAFRNDGVDIEVSEDPNSNGFNVGWIKRDERIQYTLDIRENGIYNIEVRYASTNDRGQFHMAIDDVNITDVTDVPNTGDWQNWQTLVFEDIVLTTSDSKLEVLIDNAAFFPGSFNLSSLNFVKVGSSTDLPASIVSAQTVDDKDVALILNKGMDGPGSTFEGFQVTNDGTAVGITGISVNPANNREIVISTDNTFTFENEILVSYSGDQVLAIDGTQLSDFSNFEVKNNADVISPVPGRVQAETFFDQSGVKIEATFDEAGGENNVGFLDPGDFMSYYLNIAEADNYNVSYRISSNKNPGSLRMEVISASGNTLVHRVDFPVTGNWQTYTFQSAQAQLPAGLVEIRLTVLTAGFNINWFDISNITSVEGFEPGEEVQLYPNPATGRFNVNAIFNTPRDVQIEVRNLLGKTLISREIGTTTRVNETFNASALSAGIYLVNVRSKSGEVVTRKLMIE